MSGHSGQEPTVSGRAQFGRIAAQIGYAKNTVEGKGRSCLHAFLLRVRCLCLSPVHMQRR